MLHSFVQLGLFWFITFRFPFCTHFVRLSMFALFYLSFWCDRDVENDALSCTPHNRMKKNTHQKNPQKRKTAQQTKTKPPDAAPHCHHPDARLFSSLHAHPLHSSVTLLDVILPSCSPCRSIPLAQTPRESPRAAT